MYHITMVKFHFWFLKEKGKFLLKLLFASFSPRMIWFSLSELVKAQLSYNIYFVQVQFREKDRYCCACAQL